MFLATSLFFWQESFERNGCFVLTIEKHPSNGVSISVCFLHKEGFVKDTPQLHRTGAWEPRSVPGTRVPT